MRATRNLRGGEPWARASWRMSAVISRPHMSRPLYSCASPDELIIFWLRQGQLVCAVLEERAEAMLLQPAIIVDGLQILEAAVGQDYHDIARLVDRAAQALGNMQDRA